MVRINMSYTEFFILKRNKKKVCSYIYIYVCIYKIKLQKVNNIIALFVMIIVNAKININP